MKAVKWLTWEQALFSFRFVNNIPTGKTKRKESLISTFYETSPAHLFDWLAFANSASQNYLRTWENVELAFIFYPTKNLILNSQHSHI